MRIPTLAAWFAGVALLASLIAFNGGEQLLTTFAALRWWLGAIAAYHLVPLLFDAQAWRLLFAAQRPPFTRLVMLNWIGEAINGLFPVPYLGELLRTRQASQVAGVSEGVATVVVDLTLAIATEATFALLGVLLFSVIPDKLGFVRILLPAIAVIALSGLGFYLLQRSGLFALAARIVHRWSDTARSRFDLGSANALDAGVREAYGRRAAVIHAALWRLGGWLAGTGETWLVFFALGRPIGLGEALIIESLGHAARTAAFVVPGGLGVQDGALMLLGSALGLGPDAGLVLALAKRSREMILGVPGLAAGYFLEARGLMNRLANGRLKA